MKQKFEEFLHKLTNDSALIESLLTGYDAILESDYHKKRIEDGERIINTIQSENLYNRYAGSSKIGFMFDYGDFYLVLDGKNEARIGEYKKIGGKDCIFLHILDSYLEQWMNKLAQDWSGKEQDVERVDRLVKQVVNNNKSLIVHEWNHKMDNDAGYLYDQSGKKIRRPDEEELTDKLNELLSLRNDISLDDAKSILTQVNSDVEFNAMLTAAMSEAVRNGKTGSFEEFLQAVKDSKQIKSQSNFANKTPFIDKLYKRLLKKVYLYYNSLNESVEDKKEWKIPHIEGKASISTDISPEDRTTKNLPRFANGKAKVKFQDWLCLKTIGNSVGKSPNGKWYGWSHRAMYGFGIGDKVKKGDCAYTNKEYTIKTDEQAKQTAINFADSVS